MATRNNQSLIKCINEIKIENRKKSESRWLLTYKYHYTIIQILDICLYDTEICTLSCFSSWWCLSWERELCIETRKNLSGDGRTCTCLVPLACTLLWSCLPQSQSLPKTERAKQGEEESDSKGQDDCQVDSFVHDGGLANQSYTIELDCQIT